MRQIIWNHHFWQTKYKQMIFDRRTLNEDKRRKLCIGSTVEWCGVSRSSSSGDGGTIFARKSLANELYNEWTTLNGMCNQQKQQDKLDYECWVDIQYVQLITNNSIFWTYSRVQTQFHWVNWTFQLSQFFFKFLWLNFGLDSLVLFLEWKMSAF